MVVYEVCLILSLESTSSIREEVAKQHLVASTFPTTNSLGQASAILDSTAPEGVWGGRCVCLGSVLQRLRAPPLATENLKQNASGSVLKSRRPAQKG